MPIEVGVWRVGDQHQLKRIAMSDIDNEAMLEKALATDLSLLGTELLLIGKQVGTEFGNRIDLLAMDADGTLVVIELKRSKTPREVVAQLLDYASWVKSLTYEQIAELYREHHEAGPEFEAALDEAFGGAPEKMNERHRLIVVASVLDPGSERIIEYLTQNYGVPVNAVFFRHFTDGDRRYLTRAWLIEPHEAEAREEKSGPARSAEPWNGRDFYVNVGESDDNPRRWEDWQRFGFVSGGGGAWYWKPLRLLKPGSRIFANIPGSGGGYVGVGEVVEPVVPVGEFRVKVNGKQVPITEAPTTGPKRYSADRPPEKLEYFVRVRWIKTAPRDQAYWEKGLFAIQHTACRLRSRFTIERLTKHFGVED
jgi:hypothetical protein